MTKYGQYAFGKTTEQEIRMFVMRMEHALPTMAGQPALHVWQRHGMAMVRDPWIITHPLVGDMCRRYHNEIVSIGRGEPKTRKGRQL